MLIHTVPSAWYTYQGLFLYKRSLRRRAPSILHAGWLVQSCLHCPIFLTAASRRSLVRVSVPVWGITLSGPLPIVALVSLYLTNQLIGRMPIYNRNSLIKKTCEFLITLDISKDFSKLSLSYRQVAYALRTRPPVAIFQQARNAAPRLACVKPAASVHPEPGSNSSL